MARWVRLGMIALLVPLMAAPVIPRRQVAAAGGGGSVAFDAEITAGNCTGGDCASASSTTVGLTTTAMTVGGSATCLIVVAAMHCGGAPTFAATWDSTGSAQAMSCTTSSGASSKYAAACYLTNPVTGNKTLAVTWSGQACDAYVDAISFTGTHTTTCVATGDTTTTTGSSTITVTGDANGATVAVLSNDDGDPTVSGSPTPTATMFVESPYNPGGGASYTLGTSDGTNDHTFTGGSTFAAAGMHVVAP